MFKTTEFICPKCSGPMKHAPVNEKNGLGLFYRATINYQWCAPCDYRALPSKLTSRLLKNSAKGKINDENSVRS